MTDLTEKWKRGELPEGHYYVKDGGNMIAEYLDGYFYNDGQPMTSFTGGVDEVLAKVPSYEEWQAKLEENTKLKKELKEICEKYLKINTAVSAYEDACKDLHAYIKQLKELLKECKHIMSIEKDFASCHFEKDKLCELLAKINQVLGEE